MRYYISKYDVREDLLVIIDQQSIETHPAAKLDTCKSAPFIRI